MPSKEISSPEECLEQVKAEFTKTGLYRELNSHLNILNQRLEDVKKRPPNNFDKTYVAEHQKIVDELKKHKRKYFERRLNELLIMNGHKEIEKNDQTP